ncbi:Hypothetical predicted protein [Marmota monax]|uniref:Cyclin-Y n=1 Tax=Marmota monax TaxID=9995 RepID=A0A5E4CGN7_MARMO|nr:hypothetical protein GHT09_014271 [Marmota monax]VTJ80309.1 Hypothetical predicted protein [Marmota monax]
MGNTTSCCVSSSPKLRRNAHSRLESYRPDTDLSREDTGCNLQHISDRENIDGERGRQPCGVPFRSPAPPHPTRCASAPCCTARVRASGLLRLSARLRHRRCLALGRLPGARFPQPPSCPQAFPSERPGKLCQPWLGVLAGRSWRRLVCRSRGDGNYVLVQT